MALIQKNSGSVDGNANPVTSLPSATTPGNIILIFASGSGTITTPAGFTLRKSAIYNNAIYLFEKTATGDSSDTPTLTMSGAYNGTWHIVEYSNIVYDDSSGFASPSNNTTRFTLTPTTDLTPSSGTKILFSFIDLMTTNDFVHYLGSWNDYFIQESAVNVNYSAGLGREAHGSGWSQRVVEADGSTSYTTTSSFDNAANTATYAIIIASYSATDLEPGNVETNWGFDHGKNLWHESSNDAEGVTIGTVFKTTSTAALTKIAFYKDFIDTTTSRTLSLWIDDAATSTQSMVASWTTSDEEVGNWQWIEYTLPSPVTLTPNTGYVIAVAYPNGNYFATADYFDTGDGSSDIVNGIITIPNAANAASLTDTGVQNGRYSYFDSGTSAILPNSSFNQASYYADVLLEPLPDFVCTLKSSGGDFTTIAGWEDTVACDLTSSSSQVFSISSVVNSGPSDGQAVTGVTSGATGILKHLTVDGTSCLIVVSSGTFLSGENIEQDSDNTKYITISNSGYQIGNIVLEGADEVFTASTHDINNSSWVTSPDHKLIIRPMDGCQHNGSDDGSGFTLAMNISGSSHGCLTFWTINYAIVDGVRIQAGSGSGGIRFAGSVSTTDSSFLFKNLLIENSPSTVINNVVPADITFVNCIAHNVGHGFVGYSPDSNRIKTYYCLVRGRAISSENIFRYVDARNCVAINGSNGSSGYWQFLQIGSNSTTNTLMSSDNSPAIGASGRGISQTGQWVVDPTDSNYDYHVLGTSVLVGYGAPIDGYDYDADGNLRDPSTPTVGPYEYIESSGGDEVEAIGEAEGTSTVLGVGESIATSTGSSIGTSTVLGVGEASTPSVYVSWLRVLPVEGVSAPAGSVGESTGTSIVEAVGVSVFAAVGEIETTSSVSAIGESTRASIAEAVGTSVAEAVGGAAASALIITEGEAIVLGVGESTAASVGEISATSDAIAYSAGTIAIEGNASGTSIVSGIGNSINSIIAEADGTSTVTAVGASIFAGLGFASGTTTVDGVSFATAELTGVANGDAVVSGIGRSIAAATGEISGTASVSADSSTIKNAQGNSVGTSVSSGAGASIAAAAGQIQGTTTAEAIGNPIYSSIGIITSHADVNGVGSYLQIGVGFAYGTAITVGVGRVKSNPISKMTTRINIPHGEVIVAAPSIKVNMKISQSRTTITSQ